MLPWVLSSVHTRAMEHQTSQVDDGLCCQRDTEVTCHVVSGQGMNLVDPFESFRLCALRESTAWYPEIRVQSREEPWPVWPENCSVLRHC